MVTSMIAFVVKSTMSYWVSVFCLFRSNMTSTIKSKNELESQRAHDCIPINCLVAPQKEGCFNSMLCKTTCSKWKFRVLTFLLVPYCLWPMSSPTSSPCLLCGSPSPRRALCAISSVATNLHCKHHYFCNWPWIFAIQCLGTMKNWSAHMRISLNPWI
jgi:hypothetical protein